MAPGVRRAYALVCLMLACPMSACTVAKLTPFCTNLLAKVWRSVWKVAFSISALRH